MHSMQSVTAFSGRNSYKYSQLRITRSARGNRFYFVLSGVRVIRRRLTRSVLKIIRVIRLFGFRFLDIYFDLQRPWQWNIYWYFFKVHVHWIYTNHEPCVTIPRVWEIIWGLFYHVVMFLTCVLPLLSGKQMSFLNN